MRRAATALALAAAVACAHSPSSVPSGTGPIIGAYRARLVDAEGRTHTLRLLLWAHEPDRLHAEVLGPVGGVRLTFDAGPGAASVVDHQAAVAYAGDPSPDDVRRIVGVPLAVPALVQALLSGASPEGLRVDRTGALGLPERFSVEGAEGALRLELQRLTRGSASEAALGTGSPPRGMTLRPLSELPSLSDDAAR